MNTSVVALRAFAYDGKRHAVGDRMDVSDKHVRLLVLAGTVSYATSSMAAEPPSGSRLRGRRNRRTAPYARSDMTAQQ